MTTWMCFYGLGMVVGALMLLMAEIMVAIAFISLAAPSQCDDDDDERPCKLCGCGPDSSYHTSKYHGSEVANQHEYEPEYA